MSDERDQEQAGAPVEQAAPTDTQVLAAVERNAEPQANEAVEVPVAVTETGDSVVHDTAAQESTQETERRKIAAFLEPPSASEVETASAIFAANGANAAASATAQPDVAEAAPTAEPVVAPAVVAPAPLPPVQDGEIRISADHPMAALYMQTPLPPEVKGNRGAGVLISLLATVAFAILYAGVIALWQAPHFPPSTFLNDGLLPWVLNWGFAAAVVSFFVALTVLVLILGKAGWWAYVLFSLLGAAFVWVGTAVGNAVTVFLSGESVGLTPYLLAVDYGMLFPVIAAALVAREVMVWFGAWIGARGRKVKRQNAEAVVEYEKALAEAQAK